MKSTHQKILLTALMPAVAAMFFLSSCASTVEEADPYAVITGLITKPAGEAVTFSFEEEERWETVLVDSAFELKIPLEEAAEGTLKIGAEYAAVYLEPGDKVHVTLDATQFDETIKYEGSPASQYLADLLMAEEVIREETGNPYLQSTEEFLGYVQMITTKRQDMLQASGAPKDFVSFTSLENTMQAAAMKANFPFYHSYYAKEPDFEVDASYWDFVKDIDMNNPANEASFYFGEFAETYVSTKAEEVVTEDASETDKYMARMDILDNLISNQQIRQQQYETHISNYISYNGAEGAEPLYKRFMAMCDDQECVGRVTELYDDWKKLVSGEPAPKFAYNDINGNTVSLDDLQGKVVYIDVWATWCGPCRAELPHLEAMQEEMAGREDIVFASISVDEDKEAWETMVTEDNMMGLQLHAEEAWKSSICSDYKINGIPRFMIINKDGTINNVNAPRPSSGDEIKDLLNDAAKMQVAQR